MVEVFLVQCNLARNQYQQKSEVFYTFTSNKSYACLLNVEPSKCDTGIKWVKHLKP